MKNYPARGWLPQESSGVPRFPARSWRVHNGASAFNACNRLHDLR